MSTIDQDENLKPFVAPCNKIEIAAPFRWLSLAWKDYKRAPIASVLYGLAVVVISYLVFFVAWS